MKEQLAALKQLDSLLIAIKKYTHITPKQGWVRTLRKTLGITINQFAKRLGVDPSRVVKIETAEIEDAVTLRTLQNVAQALDCQFVYYFIPNSSLEETIRDRANSVATEQVNRTSHAMDLEAQTVDEQWLAAQKDELTQELLDKPWKYLWNE